VLGTHAFNTIEPLGFSTSASVRPHKKAVKKIEAKGAKEKQLLLKPGSAIRL
jgi:predicted xylose isomerase-like sugar epimerase